MIEFCNFVEGKAARQPKDRLAFVDYLKKQHPDFPEQKMKEEYVCRKLFPKVAIPKRGKKIENLRRKLAPILEEFLIHIELRKQKTKQDFLLLDVYKRHKLDDFFKEKIKDIEEDWKKEKPVGIEQLHNEYLLKKEFFAHPNFSPVHKISGTLNDIIHRLDKYYFTAKLHLALCLHQSNSYIVSSKKDSKGEQYFIKEILHVCLNSNFQEVPQIRLLSQLLEAFIKEDFRNYPDIRKMFMSNLDLYDEYEKNDISNFLLEIWQGRPQALKELFEINREATEKGMIFENGYIPTVHFRSIVAIAAVWDIEWAENFIKEHSQFLEDKEREGTILLCEAVIDFNRGDYKEVLNKTLKVKFQDVFYKVQATSMELQCHYELNDGLSLHNSTKSFKAFLKKDREKDMNLSEKMNVAFSSFIDFTIKLEKAKYKHNPNLLNEIIRVKNIVHKNWLISKAKKLLR